MRQKQKKLKDRAGLEGYALWLLSQRDMTRHGVREKLGAYAQDKQDIPVVLDRMEELGYLDDRRFAQSYIRMCKDSRGYGPIKTRFKLKEKGISDDLVDEFLDPKDESWALKAHEMRERKFGDVPTDYDEKNRQMRFLASRCFSFDQIKVAFAAKVEIAQDRAQQPARSLQFPGESVRCDRRHHI